MPEGPDPYLRRFYYDTDLSASPHASASLRTLVDSSRVVFSWDYPSATEAAVPATTEGVEVYPGFDSRDITAIGRENALGLFPRLASTA